MATKSIEGIFKMIEHNTNSKNCWRFDDVIDDKDFLKKLTYFVIEQKKNNKFILSNRPWYDNDHIPLKEFPIKGNEDLYENILKYRKIITNIAIEKFRRQLFPILTNIVLWREGREQPRHIDVNRHTPKSSFDTLEIDKRKYTSVIYINDSYEGGETYVCKEDGLDFISIPKAGGVVFFYGDERTPHGLNKVISGNRVTINLWYTDEKKYEEQI